MLRVMKSLCSMYVVRLFAHLLFLLANLSNSQDSKVTMRKVTTEAEDAGSRHSSGYLRGLSDNVPQCHLPLAIASATIIWHDMSKPISTASSRLIAPLLLCLGQKTWQKRDCASVIGSAFFLRGKR